MKQSNVIKGTLAVVALVAALVVGVAVHMHSVGSPTAGHSTQNTAKTATETTAKTAEYITADYPATLPPKRASRPPVWWSPVSRSTRASASCIPRSISRPERLKRTRNTG